MKKLLQQWMGGSAMNRRGFIRNVAAGSLGLSLGSLPIGLAAKDDFTTISILHTNDLHCHIEPFSDGNERYANKGGLARISEMARLQRIKNKNTLLLDAGDMFQGTPYFNYYKGEVMLKVMTAAGYDLGTIGNHEFDNGLEGILNPLQNAGFPLITSNYDFSDTILAGKFDRYKIFKRDGIKIGIYALNIKLEGLVSQKNYGNTRYNDPIDIAIEMENYLRNERNCDLVICLSHLGLRYNNEKVSDIHIAKATSMTDLIIGGHTHTFLEEPVLEKNKSGKPVIVNQAWWGGLVLGQIDFVFDRSNPRNKQIFSQNLGA
jgi:5'-nucleotidase